MADENMEELYKRVKAASDELDKPWICAWTRFRNALRAMDIDESPSLTIEQPVASAPQEGPDNQ